MAKAAQPTAKLSSWYHGLNSFSLGSMLLQYTSNCEGSQAAIAGSFNPGWKNDAMFRGNQRLGLKRGTTEASICQQMWIRE